MTKEIYDFLIDLDKKILCVGDTIYSPNGRKGKVETITVVRKLSTDTIQIKGKASLE
jgi:hypothetical protein